MKPNLPEKPLTDSVWIGVPMNSIRLATIEANRK